LLAHGRWFSPASSTTKTDRHDIPVAEILLKVALKTINQIKSNLSLKQIKNQNDQLLIPTSRQV
jgi:hypothetical protein